MSDPSREVSFEADGKRYTLRYGNRALRWAEKELGKPFTQMDEGTLGDLTVLVWAGLQQYHPELSIDDVDEIFDAVGYQQLGEMSARAVQAAFPAARDGAAPGNGRTAGTGRSTSARRS